MRKSMHRGASVGTGPRTPHGASALRVALALSVAGLPACVDRSPEAPPDTPPSLHPAAVEFELVTSIPGEGASSPLFHRISPSGVQFGPTRDHVYVLDGLRNSVRVFDFDGSLIREFGGEGEAPGQMLSPTSMRIVGDHLHVRDGATNRITWFDWHGGYLGSRTSAGHFPNRDQELMTRSTASALMRHDQVLAFFGREPSRRILLLLDEGDVLVDTVFNLRGGFTYVRTRSRPEGLTDVRPIPSYGLQGSWEPIGDSLVVSLDSHHGTVRWHRVDRGLVSLVRRRDIGLTPRPIPLTESEARAQAAEWLQIPPGDIIEVDMPEFEGKLLGGFGDPETGNVWVRRTYDNYQPDDFVEHRILVPFDESEPVLELELPRNFLFRSAVDDLIAGVYVDPETEVESVRVYRWHVR